MPTEPNRERPLIGQIAGFISTGILNVLISYCLYLLVQLFVPYWLAYTISFVGSLAFSLFANARFVFRHTLTVASSLQFALVYISSFLIGLGIVLLLVEVFRIPSAIVPVLALTVLVPFNFVGSRFVLGGNNSNAGSQQNWR